MNQKASIQFSKHLFCVYCLPTRYHNMLKANIKKKKIKDYEGVLKTLKHVPLLTKEYV